MYYILLLSYLIMFLTLCINTGKHKKLYIGIVILCFSTIAMFYNPIKANYMGNYTDLYRIYQELDLYRMYGWSADSTSVYKDFYYLGNYSTLPLIKVYFFIISQVTTYNGWLPFINALLIFSMTFYIINFFGKKLFMTNKQIISIFIFFILINDFSRTIANIRMPLAIAIFIVIFIYENISKHKNNLFIWILYLGTLFIHSAMIIFIIIRLLTYLYDNKIFRKVILLSILVVPLFSRKVIVPLLEKVSISYISNGLIPKVQLYLNNGTGGLDGIKLVGWTAVIIFLSRIFIFGYILRIIKIKLHNKNSFLSMNTKKIFMQIIFFGELLVALAISSEIITIHMTNRTLLFVMNILPIYILIYQYLSQNKCSIFSIKYLSKSYILMYAFVLLQVLYYFMTHVYKVFVF